MDNKLLTSSIFLWHVFQRNLAIDFLISLFLPVRKVEKVVFFA